MSAYPSFFQSGSRQSFGTLRGSSLPGLTLVLQGEIFLQGEIAQPGPGEFIIETFDLGPLTSTGFIPLNRR
jgi:hypothetical protein